MHSPQLVTEAQTGQLKAGNMLSYRPTLISGGMGRRAFTMNFKGLSKKQ